ncbi:MAG: hypothetical protein K9M57_03580 [Phycisphaerae bacterium]|nr:hypothetical protein [Phycisphaerae bacterium]
MHNHEPGKTCLNHEESFPRVDRGGLVIMGGPMNIYQYDRCPWHKRENAFIATAIAKNKIILGIFLGAAYYRR